MSEPLEVALADLLRRWQSGAVGPAEVKRWAEEQPATRDLPDPLREVLAALDLLEVHLLTVEDVPALLALAAGGEGAVATWRAYRDAIDLDARSKKLRKIPFYRPFCR